MYRWTDGCTDVRMDGQIPPVFYRFLSPPVPSGAAAQKEKEKERKKDEKKDVCHMLAKFHLDCLTQPSFLAVIVVVRPF